MIIPEKAGYFFYNGLRLGLGLFFLIVGMMKLTQIHQLAEDIERFRIVPYGYEWYLACLGVALEIAIGVFLLLKQSYFVVTLAGSLLTFSFVAIFAQAWIRGLELSCNCLGVERQVTNYFFEVSWRILLFLSMLLLLRDSFKKAPRRFEHGVLDTSDLP